MATERALSGSDLSDCREALINAVVDALAGYQRILGQTSSTLRMPAEGGLQYMPIYVLGLLKHRAFSGAQKASMDERMASLLMFKTVGIEILLME
uniref:Sec23/Sec24 helical domain-containing protein n=1 Tax=Meloidogyne javanica TaxID=6303 RepID=A0A915MK07_MELJA